MNFRLRTLTTCLGLIGCTGFAHAAGFNLLEQNASGLGNAYAGSAASIENPSAMYFNPAALTQLEGLQISTGINFVRPGFKFKDDGTSRIPGARDGVINPSSKGSNGGDAGSLGIVPNFYLSYKVNDRIGLGLGISAPFGLKTEYSTGWLGRFHSQAFDIKTININPAIAFKVNDSLSIGAGLNIQRIEAAYEKTGVSRLPSANPLLNNKLGIQFDSNTKIKNTAYGWNVGLMFHPSESTRIGLSYRSRIKHKASGHTDIAVDLNPTTAAGIMTQAGVPAAAIPTILGALGKTPKHFSSKATVSLPDMAVLSAYHRLNEQWEIMGDIAWTGWSSIPKLTISSVAPGTQPRETTLNLKFKDTWRVALGANYAVNDQWKLKMGVAWDQSPIRDAKHRPASLPDSDRLWVSLGVQFKPSQYTTIDAGYTHIFTKKSKINNDNGNVADYGRLSGTYKTNANIFGLQVSHRFF